MEKASAAGGEPALSSDTRRYTLGSPGKRGRKEGGREGGAQSARCVAWQSRSWRQGAAYTNSKCFALGCNQTRATRPVRQSPVNQPRLILSGPSVRPAALSRAPPARSFSVGGLGFFFLRPSSQACRGLQKREDSKRSIGAGRFSLAACLLAACAPSLRKQLGTV